MAQWCSAGWLLFPGASSRWGKAYPSTRVSGIKRPRSICFLSHHGQCLLHLLIYASQDERETQLIKHEHKALGKKDTRRCGEARGSALYMGALCMEWQGDSNVKTLFFFFGFHKLEVVLPAGLLEWVFPNSITGHLIQSLPSNSEVRPLLRKSCKDYLRVHTCLFKGEEQRACVKHQRQKEMGHVGIDGLPSSWTRNN